MDVFNWKKDEFKNARNPQMVSEKGLEHDSPRILFLPRGFKALPPGGLSDSRV